MHSALSYLAFYSTFKKDALTDFFFIPNAFLVKRFVYLFCWHSIQKRFLIIWVREQKDDMLFEAQFM